VHLWQAKLNVNIMLGLAAALSLLTFILLPRLFVSSWWILELARMSLNSLNRREKVQTTLVSVSNVLQILEAESKQKTNVSPLGRSRLRAMVSSGASDFPRRFLLMFMMMHGELHSSATAYQVFEKQLHAIQVKRLEHWVMRVWWGYCFLFFLTIGILTWKLTESVEALLMLLLLSAFALKTMSMVFLRPFLVSKTGEALFILNSGMLSQSEKQESLRQKGWTLKND
jgi:hypothetical protein